MLPDESTFSSLADMLAVLAAFSRRRLNSKHHCCAPWVRVPGFRVLCNPSWLLFSATRVCGWPSIQAPAPPPGSASCMLERDAANPSCELIDCLRM